MRTKQRFGVLFIVTLAVGALFVPAATAASSVPYTDANAVGSIGLCDAAGNSLDHGQVADQPFVHLAVSSVAAPAPYDADGRTATLFAYQPRKGIDPNQWSGQLLTASTRYSDPTHPTALATAGDDSLATFIDTYPPQWKGMIELRLYLGAPGQAPRTRQYAATDIAVSGDTWTVVRGGSTPCNAQGVQSVEDLVPQNSVIASASPLPAAPSPNAELTPSQAAHDSTGLWTQGHLEVVVLVAALVVIGFTFAWRRRTRAVAH